jgi:hypothetical protein
MSAGPTTSGAFDLFFYILKRLNTFKITRTTRLSLLFFTSLNITQNVPCLNCTDDKIPSPQLVSYTEGSLNFNGQSQRYNITS